MTEKHQDGEQLYLACMKIMPASSTELLIKSGRTDLNTEQLDSLLMADPQRRFFKEHEADKWELSDAGQLFIEIYGNKTASASPREIKVAEGISAFLDFRDLGQQFWRIQPFFFDQNHIWWLWDHGKASWQMTDETELLNMIDKCLKTFLKTIDAKIKNELVETLRRIGRSNIPAAINNNWIQLGKNVMDIKTGNVMLASPIYFITNSIPWDAGISTDTPFIDSLFDSWVGRENRDMLYELTAYCLLPAYPIHRIFCLNGAGMNGKTTYLNLLIRFLGKHNCCATDLDTLINSRFESGRLYKKLVCIMGETNFGLMKRTQLLKRLTGEDMVGFEIKHKNLFDDVNYAKMFIATNSLPMTTDKTVGFYRRWLVINFNNIFAENKNILDTIPLVEFSNLAAKCAAMLLQIVERGAFTGEPDNNTKKEMYERLSNPLKFFLSKECEHDTNSKTIFSEFYKRFVKFLDGNGFREMSAKEVAQRLSIEGFDRKTLNIIRGDKETTAKFIIGLAWKGEQSHDAGLEKFSDIDSKFARLSATSDMHIDFLKATGFMDSEIEGLKSEGRIIETSPGRFRRV